LLNKIANSRIVSSSIGYSSHNIKRETIDTPNRLSVDVKCQIIVKIWHFDY
jgi:hypothetical protein